MVEPLWLKGRIWRKLCACSKELAPLFKRNCAVLGVDFMFSLGAKGCHSTGIGKHQRCCDIRELRMDQTYGKLMHFRPQPEVNDSTGLDMGGGKPEVGVGFFWGKRGKPKKVLSFERELTTHFSGHSNSEKQAIGGMCRATLFRSALRTPKPHPKENQKRNNQRMLVLDPQAWRGNCSMLHSFCRQIKCGKPK